MKLRGAKSANIIIIGVLVLGLVGLLFSEFQKKPKTLQISEQPFEDFKVSKYPPELSIESLKNMKLKGTNLTFVEQIRDHYSYVSHQVFYYSKGVKVSGVLSIPKGKGPFPVIILNHGWYPLEKYKVGTGLKRELDYFSKHRYVTFHPDYRDHAKSDKNVDPRKIYDGSLGFAMDTTNAVYALENANLPELDMTRVGLLGHSMGGDIGMDVAVTKPYLFDAMVLYAPANTNAWKNFDRWKHQDFSWPFIKRTLDTLGDYKSNPENWNAMSATPYLEEVQVPIQIYHGAKDEIVPLSWSQDLAKRLKELGKSVELIIYPEEDHEFQEGYSDYIFGAHDFFDQYLANSRAEWK